MTKQPDLIIAAPDDGLWKPFTSVYNRFGVLFVEEVPRAPGESGENYCRRVANQYTLQAGVEYRNERLKQDHAQGKSKKDLALLYGLRMQELRDLLYQLGLDKKPEPPKPITAEIRYKIIYMRRQGKSYAEVEAATGIKTYRASNIWDEFQRKERHARYKAEAERQRNNPNAKETA